MNDKLPNPFLNGKFSSLYRSLIWNIFLTGRRWESVNKWLFFWRYQEHLEMILCTINSTATPHLFCARKRNETKHTINDNKKPGPFTPITRSLPSFSLNSQVIKRYGVGSFRCLCVGSRYILCSAAQSRIGKWLICSKWGLEGVYRGGGSALLAGWTAMLTKLRKQSRVLFSQLTASKKNSVSLKQSSGIISGGM